jgi:hypothetical protein
MTICSKCGERYGIIPAVGTAGEPYKGTDLDVNSETIQGICAKCEDEPNSNRNKIIIMSCIVIGIILVFSAVVW